MKSDKNWRIKNLGKYAEKGSENPLLGIKRPTFTEHHRKKLSSSMKGRIPWFIKR